MFGFTGHKTTDVIVASAASLSSYCLTRGYNHVAVEVPAFGTLLAESTANVEVYGCATATGTYRVIKDEGNYSAGASIDNWEVPSTTGNWICVCRPAARFDYIKVHFSTAATDSITATIHLHR